jgi:hypothetical protein
MSASAAQVVTGAGVPGNARAQLPKPTRSERLRRAPVGYTPYQRFALPLAGGSMASLDEIRNALWNDEFADREDATEYVLEQYKLCIEMADRISQRRGAANTFFLNFNTALVGALAGFYDEVPRLVSVSF